MEQAEHGRNSSVRAPGQQVAQIREAEITDEAKFGQFLRCRARSTCHKASAEYCVATVPIRSVDFRQPVSSLSVRGRVLIFYLA